VNGQAYTWDDNGNLLDDGANTYAYDSANRLISVNNTQSSTLSTYGYIGLGDRVAQTVNGVTTNYALDLNAGLTQVLSDGANTYLYGNGRIGELQPGGFAYHLGDALGSVRQLTDADGVVRMARSYEPYGSVMGSVGAGSSVFGYASEQVDSYTELLFLRARMYRPETGSFQSKDLWRDYNRPQTLNGWNYVMGDPVNHVDPSGLRGLRPWNDYQKQIESSRGVKIDAATIRSREISLIILNFEGNPYPGSVASQLGEPVTHPNEVQCYNAALAVDIGWPAGQKLQEFPRRNYDQFDWLISGWVDYWAWRAKRAGQAVLDLHPNMVKALAWNESKLNARTSDGGTLLNLNSGALKAIVRGEPLNPFSGQPLQGTDKQKALQTYGLTWGWIDYSNKYDVAQEVGATVRWLYASYHTQQKGRTDSSAVWTDVFQAYGPKSSSDQYIACYGEMTWEIYETGRRHKGCDSERLWYIWGTNP
jgi:RHS repeat-associated protein